MRILLCSAHLCVGRRYRITQCKTKLKVRENVKMLLKNISNLDLLSLWKRTPGKIRVNDVIMCH